MSTAQNKVCLTDKQQKFYNYFINYYKNNGMFPNVTTAARELGCSSTAAAAYYGTLLLKGAFTNGQPLTRTNKARHNTTIIQPVNLSNFKLDPPPRRRLTRQPEQAQGTKPQLNKRQLASLLVKLFSEDKVDAQAIAQLFA